MSDLMLHGKLNMPLPDEPQDCDVVTWVQFKAAAKEAADRIEELEAKLATLEDAARSALEYVEHKESEWGVNLAMGNKLRAALASLQGDKT